MFFLMQTETLLDIFEDMTEPVLRQILLLNNWKKQNFIACNIFLSFLMEGEWPYDK